jgi:hypothetical protein
MANSDHSVSKQTHKELYGGGAHQNDEAQTITICGVTIPKDVSEYLLLQEDFEDIVIDLTAGKNPDSVIEAITK